MRFVENGEALCPCTAWPSLALHADALLWLRCQEPLGLHCQRRIRTDVSSRTSVRRLTLTAVVSLAALEHRSQRVHCLADEGTPSLVQGNLGDVSAQAKYAGAYGRHAVSR